MLVLNCVLIYSMNVACISDGSSIRDCRLITGKRTTSLDLA